MLSRTAANLFWMARYIERAEATARLITMGQRMAILPGAHSRDEWRSVLRVTGCESLFPKDAIIRETDVVDCLLLDPDNPSSVRSCLSRARENGKSVRTALTQDMWEALNEGWRKLDGYDVATARVQLASLLDWVRNRAMVFRGAADSGHLRNEGYDFLRIGSSLECSEMTLRLLDVKYYVLLPETEVVGGTRDHYQWASVLHALSGNRAYHHVYGGGYAPWQITDFLILSKIFPRSVAYCWRQISYRLIRLSLTHDDVAQSNNLITRMVRRLEGLDSGEIFSIGLHEMVTECLKNNARLGDEIASSYHFN